MDIAAGEYGYDLPYFRRMLEAGAVDVLQADASALRGDHRFLADRGSLLGPFSAIVGALRPVASRARLLRGIARAPPGIFSRPCPHRAACCSMASAAPVDGALVPDLSRPGIGLELKVADARRFVVWTSPNMTNTRGQFMTSLPILREENEQPRFERQRDRR